MENSTPHLNDTPLWKKVLGWAAVGISTVFSLFWAYWGALENFHEGWFSTSFFENIELMLVQYAAPLIVFLLLTFISLRWPKIGAGIFAGLGILFVIYFSKGAGANFLGLPLVLLGALYWFGTVKPGKYIYLISIVLPIVVFLGLSVEPAIRVSGRYYDGSKEAKIIEGNGIKLMWAPPGPGWPKEGISFEEAKRHCRYLTADGKSLADTIQDLWRMPTIEEVVRSMTRHNINSKGVWDPKSGTATYETTPDKESPLWDPHSQIIYWWTSTEKDSNAVYMIVYDGSVYPRAKRTSMGDRAFRAVRTVPN